MKTWTKNKLWRLGISTWIITISQEQQLLKLIRWTNLTEPGEFSQEIDTLRQRRRKNENQSLPQSIAETSPVFATFRWNLSAKNAFYQFWSPLWTDAERIRPESDENSVLIARYPPLATSISAFLPRLATWETPFSLLQRAGVTHYNTFM